MAVHFPSPACRPAAKEVEDGCCVELDAPLLTAKPEKGASFLRTCFNCLNALSGVGILSVPYALSQGGWWSLGLLVLTALLCCYTGLLLQRCMSIDDPWITTYPDIGERAFGLKGRLAVSLFMYLELYLVAVEFLILEGDNLDKLFPGRTFDLGVAKMEGKKFFTVAAALVILPTTWLRNMRTLALFSVGGVAASLVVVGSVLWVGVFDGVGFRERGTLFKPSGVPTAMGLYAFCYCAHAVFPTLRTSMEKKSQFPKVMYICFVVCALNYGSMAVMGYLMYGEGLQSQITLNLPKHKVASHVAIGMTLISPFTKYALMVTPLAVAIEERFLVRDNILMCCLVRTMLVASSLLIAVSVPFFGYVTAFIGSFLGMAVCVLLPCLCYLKIFQVSAPESSSSTQRVLVYGIIAVGILVAVTGTCDSVSKIIGSL